MKHSLPRVLAVLLLASAALTACNTGTKSGDTNVEAGTNKSSDPDPGQSTTSDSATSGLQRDTSRTPTGRQLYENAANAKDRNNDGVAD